MNRSGMYTLIPAKETKTNEHISFQLVNLKAKVTPLSKTWLSFMMF